MNTKLDRKLAKFQKLNAKANELRSEITQLAGDATAAATWANGVVATTATAADRVLADGW